MERRRWIALLIAIILVVASISVQLVTSLTSNLFSQLTEIENQSDEMLIRDGDFDKKIAVVSLNGVIMDLGKPSFFDDGYNHETFLNNLERAFEDDSVDAIILEVDSPGGGVFETEEIHRLIQESKEEFDKPLYVSMGGMAASGGYYVAAPADKIFAHPTTITGSIGVIMESINYAGLAEKHGVAFNTIKSGKHKDIMSASREMTKEEKEIMQSMIDEMYDEFVRVIVDGRGLDEKMVRNIGDGRIYTGKQAKEVDLVDEIGNLDDTIDQLMADYQLENAKVIQYYEEEGLFSFLTMEVKQLFQSDSELAKIQKMLTESDQPRAMYIY